MPVEMSMFCAWPEPAGVQSRLTNTSIRVSFVFLEILAVLAAILDVQAEEREFGGR